MVGVSGRVHVELLLVFVDSEVHQRRLILASVSTNLRPISQYRLIFVPNK